MVYGAILYRGEKFYTDLHAILEKMDGFCEQYNWLISDCFCLSADEETNRLLHQDKNGSIASFSLQTHPYTWLDGKNFGKAAAHVHQWIWGGSVDLIHVFQKNPFSNIRFLLRS